MAGDRNDFKDCWALITGASSGIGAALAREIAGRGANLVLTARRVDRLEALAEELRASGRSVRTVPADLNQATAPQAIFDATADLAIDILVNNAGLGQFGAFVTNEIEQELSQVRVNCEATVHLTRLFLPRMIERKRGWVLILASTASYQPVPYLATYAASKAFDRYFAEGLAAELRPMGIHVTALCPGPTESEFFQVARAGVVRGRSVLSAESVARRGVDALIRGKGAVIPYFEGRLLANIVRLLPVKTVTTAIERLYRPR